MSFWTHIRGMITVSPMGRTQPEKRYILDTVLEHLPLVTGSEGDMEVHVIQRSGHDMSSSHDEFGMRTNNLVDILDNGIHTRKHGMYEVQTEYFLVLEADLRDRVFEQTKKEFVKWLVRLSKRVLVYDVMVEVSGDTMVEVNGEWEKKWLITDWRKFHELNEAPSWSSDYVQDQNSRDFNGPNWCEYLMWDRGYNTDMPLKLMYKYYVDKKNDEEFERRKKWDEES